VQLQQIPILTLQASDALQSSNMWLFVNVLHIVLDGDVQGMPEGAQLHGAADTHWQQKEGRSGRNNCWGLHSLHLSGA
jgi:hypothetical protein